MCIIAERIKRQNRRVFDLFGGVNCNFKAIESLGGVERRYIRPRRPRHSVSRLQFARNWLSAVQLTITNEY